MIRRKAIALIVSGVAILAGAAAGLYWSALRRAHALPPYIVKTNGWLEFARIDIAVKNPDRIVELSVHEGEHAGAGQTLAKRDDAELNAQLAGARTQRAAALAALTPLYMAPAPTGYLPVPVLEGRPDVQATAALVQAHAARIESAKTDLLPRFGMEFLGGDAELHFAGRPSFGATSGLIGLSAYLPVFNADRIRANIAATDARLNAAVAYYEAVVLRALEDVENTCRMRSALDDEDELVQTQMGQATAAVQLYRALGGGW